MLGIDLSSLKEELHKVPVHQNYKPINTIKDLKLRAVGWERYIEIKEGESVSSLEYYRIPLSLFNLFSFDEFCKFVHSTIIMMHESVRNLFEENPQHEIFRKIRSSMWRWSHSKSGWNEIVDAYNNLRNFSFINDTDFEIRLDHSTYFNECGCSKYTRTFLDGVFGLLIYYKGKHVLTVGFSILGGKRILVQQVQLVNRKGNRFLYKLPRNLIEFVIELFAKNFIGYKLYIVNGESLVGRIIGEYKDCLSRIPDEKERSVWETESYLICSIKIRHLEADSPRIISFYGNTGKYKTSGEFKFNKGLYHMVLLE